MRRLITGCGVLAGLGSVPLACSSSANAPKEISLGGSGASGEAGSQAGSSGSAGSPAAGASGAAGSQAGSGGTAGQLGGGGGSAGTSSMPPVDPPSAPSQVDAALAWPTGKAYFFRGSEYIRVSAASGVRDAGYPKQIEVGWKGVWPAGISAAVAGLGGDKAYFFREGQVTRFDISLDEADAGFPKQAAELFPGLMGNVAAAYALGNELVLITESGKYHYQQSAGAYELSKTEALAEKERWDGALSHEARLLRIAALGIHRTSAQAADASHFPLRCRFFGLWDEYYGSGDPAENLPQSIAGLLIESPSAAEVAARKARVKQSITTETDLSPSYPIFLASVEEKLSAYGCLLLRKTDGAHRFRCATDTAGVNPIAINPLHLGGIHWARASHHSVQVSQGDFVADVKSPLTISVADNNEYYVEKISANPATGSISAGLNIRVRFEVNGTAHSIGFSHLNVAVPAYAVEAQKNGTPLPTGVAFGFIGYTGNLGIAAPPATDQPHTDSWLPVAHSHLYFVADLQNHEKLTNWARHALCYGGGYPYGGGLVAGVEDPGSKAVESPPAEFSGWGGPMLLGLRSIKSLLGVTQPLIRRFPNEAPRCAGSTAT